MNEVDIYNLWFLKKGLGENSKELYTIMMNQFLEHEGLKLQELYGTIKQYECINDTDIGVRIMLYLDMISKTKSPNTAWTTKTVLQSFCTAMGVGFVDIKIHKHNLAQNYRRGLKREEIMELMEYGDVRAKALISLSATTGMSANEIRHLTMNDLYSCLNEELGTDYGSVKDLVDNLDTILGVECYPLILNRIKAHHIYHTYIPSETVERIILYCKSKKLFDKEDHVFVNTRGKNKGEMFGTRTQASILKQIASRIGFDSNRGEGQYSLFVPHQLRRFFYTNVLNTVGVFWADLWTGHKLSTVRDAYTRFDETTREKYLECLPYISLKDKQMSLSEIEEYNLLKEKQEMIEKSYDLLEKIRILKDL